MFKIFDEDVFGELLVIDDGGGLTHHEVTEHLLISEPLTFSQSHVGPPETFPAHQDLLGIGAAKGEGRLLMRNSLLRKEVKSSGTNPVKISKDQSEEKQYFHQHDEQTVGRSMRLMR